MKLAVKASQAAHEDLSDFFELWGFFIPGKGVIEQYGTYDYLVTEEMIRKAKAEMSIYPIHIKKIKQVTVRCPTT